VIQKKCVNALNILDRFHIAKKFNEAVDKVRRDEVKELKDAGSLRKQSIRCQSALKTSAKSSLVV
jgi:transposase